MRITPSVTGLTRNVINRTVHLRLSPRPQGLADSLQILELLQGYGKVEMFKSLKYEAIPVPNSMIAVFQTEDAARKLLRQSPLRFTLSQQDVEEEAVPDAGNALTAASAESANTPSEPFSSDRNALAEGASHPVPLNPYGSSSGQSLSSSLNVQQYQLVANTATMKLRDMVDEHPYNGPFAINSKSAIQLDLAKRVPLIGLSEVDLKKAQKPPRLLHKEQDKEKRRKSLRQMYERAQRSP